MEILIAVGILAVLVLLAYVAWKVREIIVRLLILDVRLRVIETLCENEHSHQALYEKIFMDMYIAYYERIVRFAYENIDMGLSWLKPSERLKKEAAKEANGS